MIAFLDYSRMKTNNKQKVYLILEKIINNLFIKLN